MCHTFHRFFILPLLSLMTTLPLLSLMTRYIKFLLKFVFAYHTGISTIFPCQYDSLNNFYDVLNILSRIAIIFSITQSYQTSFFLYSHLSELQHDIKRNKWKCISLCFYFMIGFFWSLYLHTIFLWCAEK